MPTSPPPRCIPASPTSTSAASTSRPTHARGSGRASARPHTPRPGPSGASPFLLACISLALLAACNDGGGKAAPAATTTPGATVTPAPSSTGQDEPPPRDPVDLARRLRGQPDPPRQVSLPAPVEGAAEPFTLLTLPASSDDPPEVRMAAAALRATSEHAYFFVEEGSDVPDEEVQDAARAFEEEVWPQVTGAFGLPPIPGVDGDPRIAILHADLGDAVGGYVSGDDPYPRVVAPLSNQRELVYLNLSVRPLGGAGYARLLAHELQHVIHGRLDANEEAWVNEGLSEVAAGLLGARGDAPYSSFLDRPDTQLNGWGRNGQSAAHYAGSALFFTYLLEQAGGRPEELAAQTSDGIDGVEAFLRERAAGRTFQELFADWLVANELDQPDGPYGYREREVGPPETIEVEAGPGEGDVAQFGADYLELDAERVGSEPVLTFEGEPDVPWLSAQGQPGAGAFWWSNRGDNIDSRLTRELDLTQVGKATLAFRTWFDIEDSFDYAYVDVSQDGGRTWKALAGQQTTTDDPLGVSYGPGYTGRSGGGDEPGWVDERIDLTPYAGRRVLLRFELITDDAVNQPGWALDDVAVPEIGFLDDAQSDPGGWRRDGFRPIDQPLAQRFLLRLIKLGAAPTVEPIVLNRSNRAEVRLAGLGSDYQSAIIVIAGATEGTSERGRYRFRVQASS